MAGRSVEEILRSEVIVREVSRVKLPNTVLSDLWGWGLSNRDPASQGANKINVDARDGKYDVFNMTREVATGRVPGTASARMKPQKVGKVLYTVPRSAETIPLTDEDLINRRVIGGPSNILDSAGENYISRQFRYMAQRYGNMIEFQTAAMLRGSYTFDQDGDTLYQTFTGGADTIDYQIGDDNKDTLKMGTGSALITANWSVAGTNIPLQLYGINEAFNNLTGRGLEHIACGSDVWNNVMNNTAIINQGGSANLVFETLDKRGPGNFTAVLRALPWLQWHIIDYTLSVWDGTSAFSNQKLIEDNHAFFFPEPDGEIAQYFDGGEMVTEGPNGVRTFRHGFYSFGYPTHDPSGWNIAAYHNGFPALYSPDAIAYGDTEGA
jgi:hypothetical protein